jgi:hypothetical protein
LLATGLLASGDRTEARGIAAALRTSALTLHQVEGDLIMVRVETSEARFGAAFADARKASELRPDDVGWVREQRFEIAWRSLELAMLLGRTREVADAIVEHFLAPDPPPLDSNAVEVPTRIPAICVRSSAPTACFVRFHALRQRLPGAITADTDELLAGAECYARGELRCAARAWRPLLRGMVLPLVLPDEMVKVFERTGAVNLAEQVDAEVMKRADELNGATLAHVRVAHRALARGDRETARQRAQEVINAWSLADEVPSAVDDMKRLQAELDAR